MIELLKSYFKIHDRDDHRAIREKVTEKLFALDESLKYPRPRRSWRCLTRRPAIRSGRSSTRNFAERKLSTRVKWLLLRESQVQPLLVVFEDLHWIDSRDASGSQRLRREPSRRPASCCS